MQNIGEKIKFVRENNEVSLKLYNKNSASYFGIWLMARGIEYKFVSIHNENDLIYNLDEDKEYEYLFWLKKG
jgi:hypothetical protein